MPTFACCSLCTISRQFKFPELKDLLKIVLFILFIKLPGKLPGKLSIPLSEKWTPSSHKRLLPISLFEI